MLLHDTNVKFQYCNMYTGIQTVYFLFGKFILFNTSVV